jgi:ABC-type branched-subunit amino acid transport system substrate-binding protein
MDAARKLIEVDKVKIISGGFSSGVALPIAKILPAKQNFGCFPASDISTFS